jgi:hypothetical protein
MLTDAMRGRVNHDDASAYMGERKWMFERNGTLIRGD